MSDKQTPKGDPKPLTEREHMPSPPKNTPKTTPPPPKDTPKTPPPPKDNPKK